MTLLDSSTTNYNAFQGMSPATQPAALTLTFNAGTPTTMTSTAKNMVFDLSSSIATQTLSPTITFEVDFYVSVGTPTTLAL